MILESSLFVIRAWVAAMLVAMALGKGANLRNTVALAWRPSAVPRTVALVILAALVVVEVALGFSVALGAPRTVGVPATVAFFVAVTGYGAAAIRMKGSCVCAGPASQGRADMRGLLGRNLTMLTVLLAGVVFGPASANISADAGTYGLLAAVATPLLLLLLALFRTAQGWMAPAVRGRTATPRGVVLRGQLETAPAVLAAER